VKKLLVSTLLLVVGLSPAFAQTQGSDDYPKFELYAGFSHNRAETVLFTNPVIRSDGRAGLNGFDVAVTRNVSRYVGVQFDFAGHFGEEIFRPPCLAPCPDPPPDVRIDSSLYTFLGGVQIKDNARSTRFRPFARVLVGAARLSRDDDPDPTGQGPSCLFETPPCGRSKTGFAAALGGGLDIRAGRRLDVRLIQLDYNPTRFNGTTLHNSRIGFGVNIH
jgi:hypothetical protein